MRVVLVAGICVERDAISASVARQAQLLSSLPEVTDVSVVTQHCDRSMDVPTLIAWTAWDLARSPVVAAADVVIFHWGIRYDLFDALPVVASRTQTAVYFHNLTPATLSLGIDADVIERSVLQIQLLHMTDSAIWAPSEFNLSTLCDWGIDPSRMRTIPFPVERPWPITARSGEALPRLLTVGRFVSSKGLHVLVDALACVVERIGRTFTAVIAGSRSLSDTAYLEQLESQIDHLGLRSVIDVRLDLDDRELWAEYDAADVLVVPSFHEGLCVPVIEAYVAGCRVVASDGGNLPHVVQAPDPVVPAGDVGALADALTEMLTSGLDGHPQRASVDRLVASYSRAAATDALQRGVADLANARR